LNYLKSGNEDYGKSDNWLASKYNISPADFGHDIASYNNVVRHLSNERQKQMSRAMMFDSIFKQAMLFIESVLGEREEKCKKIEDTYDT